MTKTKTSFEIKTQFLRTLNKFYSFVPRIDEVVWLYIMWFNVSRAAIVDPFAVLSIKLAAPKATKLPSVKVERPSHISCFRILCFFTICSLLKSHIKGFHPI